MSDNSQTASSPIARAGRVISSSAEYVVALGLLLVCAVVGLAVWLSGPSAPQEEEVIRIVAPAQLAVEDEISEEQLAEEQAALARLQEQLRLSLEEVESAGRQEFEQAERARQEELERQAEAERRAAELAEQQRLAEEKVARLQAELEARRKRAAAEAARAESAAAKPQRTSATVDWSSCRKPVYPRSARMNGDEGLVVLALDIDAVGRVTDGRIQKSSGSRDLDRTTLRALRQCAFNPATVDGQPNAVTGLVEFNWSLR